MKSKRPVSKKELNKHLEELINLAKSITPDVVHRVQIPGFEGQHAWLEIYVPDEVEEKVDDLIGERANDILLATGYDIGAIVCEKSELAEDAAALQA